MGFTFQSREEEEPPGKKWVYHYCVNCDHPSTPTILYYLVGFFETITVWLWSAVILGTKHLGLHFLFFFFVIRLFRVLALHFFFLLLPH